MDSRREEALRDRAVHSQSPLRQNSNTRQPRRQKDAEDRSPILRDSTIQSSVQYILGGKDRREQPKERSQQRAELNSTGINFNNFKANNDSDRQPNFKMHHSKPFDQPDALDSFMQPSKQQQNQIQMLTAAQQLAFISNNRAETSAVKNSSPSSGFVYRNAPSSGHGHGHGISVGKHVFN